MPQNTDDKSEGIHHTSDSANPIHGICHCRMDTKSAIEHLIKARVLLNTGRDRSLIMYHINMAIDAIRGTQGPHKLGWKVQENYYKDKQWQKPQPETRREHNGCHSKH